MHCFRPTCLVALAIALRSISAATAPACGTDVQKLFAEPSTTACFDVIPEDYTYKQFCADVDCRTFLAALTKVATTDCTVNGKHTQLFIDNAQGCRVTPVATDELPTCGSDVEQVYTETSTKTCLDALPDNYTYTQFCARADCRTFLGAITKVVKTPCKRNGGNLQAFIANARGCPSPPETTAPSIQTTTAPPVPLHSSPNNSTAVVVGIVSGVVVVLVLVIAVLVVRRRKQRDRDEPEVQVGPPSKNPQGDSYAAISDVGTADATRTTMIIAHDLEVLAPLRIPYHHIEPGPVITQGGFGEVLRARYNDMDVAVKRLLPSRAKDPQSIRSFVKEIQLTASLHHDCIVRFIGAAWDDGASLCMVSEFMHGGDLRSLLERYSRDGHRNGHDDTKLRIAVQVAHAMTYLHSLHPPVVHRDLKSRNILLTAALDAKIIDFGISRERQDLTMTAGIGTSLWMAPEVMQGEHYDEKADVFSFGVILSELDTHELPYDHAREIMRDRHMTSMVLMQMISQGRLKPRFTDVAKPAIVALARDCLNVDRTQRPSSAEVMHRIIQCFLHETTLTVQSQRAIDRSMLTFQTRATTKDPVFTEHSTSIEF